MMPPFQHLVPWKRIWGVVVGLGLIAGAIVLFLRPSVSTPDSTGKSAGSAPAGLPADSAREDMETANIPLVAAEELPLAARVELAPAEYDARLTALTEAVRADRDAGEEARPRIPALLESTEPMDQVIGLAQMAGLGQLDAQQDLARHPPEVVLAAVDLCASQFGESAARSLLDQWMADMGGAQAAAGMAHNLLLEARLPYGGGSTALELMIGVNDPQAIFVGLYEFAVNSKLPAAVRTEALVRLRDHVEPDAYRTYVGECADLAQQNGDAWAVRAERLRERLDAPMEAGAYVEAALARPYPGMVEDLELDLRHGIRTGRVQLDSETAAAFRNALAALDESALPGPDGIALRRLRGEIDLWQNKQ